MATAGLPNESLKHWRSFGHAEWVHVREGVVGLGLGSVVPVLLFYSSLRLWGFPPSVVIVLVWSAAIFYRHRLRTGGNDVFSAASFAFAVIQAAVGLISQDPILYLAAPSIENLIYGGAFVLSAAFGKPLLGLYAQRLYPIPPTIQASGTYRRALLVTSGVWFVGLALRALLRIVLLVSLPLEIYLVVNTVAGWPFSAILVGFTIWYPLRQLRRAGLMAQPPPLVGDVEEAIEEATPGGP